MIKRLLIANRGEIACRIMRTARAMGIETVAVYSDADAGADHVQQADRAVRLGPAPVGDSYLNIDAILAAAQESGADAVHPGYGFLSENGVFACAVAEADLTFVGPTAEVIETMGDKREARLIAEAAGVPCVPGYDGEIRDDDTLRAEAVKLGAPVMIKATAGGGGRGMRRVDDLKDFDAALASARREAGAAFGNSDMLLERVIAPARHVEVQILGDAHGNVIHLGERDCSAQRRHQKVIEEAPCSTLPDSIRTALCDAAVKLAKHVGYTGAGTVEFIVGEDDHFYFLEMNTRLQVEHPVTEDITGIDLVAEQIRVAAGECLSVTQNSVSFSGHAIEVRLYAEDPANGFMPQTGTLHGLEFPEGIGRVDSGVGAGGTVSPFYDPMLAKLIAHAPTRDEARLKLLSMLRKTAVAGVTTNKAYLIHLLESDAFRDATHRTSTLDRLDYSPRQDVFTHAGLAAAIRLYDALESFPHASLSGWRTVHFCPERRTIEVHDTRVPLTLTYAKDGDGWRFTVANGDETTEPHITGGKGRYSVRQNGEELSIGAATIGDSTYLDLPTGHAVARDITLTPPQRAATTGTGHLKAPMDGQVVALGAAAGEQVSEGDLIVVIEAMKMEHQVRADIAGTLTELTVEMGMQVKAKQPLAVITPDGEGIENAEQ